MIETNVLLSLWWSFSKLLRGLRTRGSVMDVYIKHILRPLAVKGSTEGFLEKF